MSGTILLRNVRGLMNQVISLRWQERKQAGQNANTFNNHLDDLLDSLASEIDTIDDKLLQFAPALNALDHELAEASTGNGQSENKRTAAIRRQRQLSKSLEAESDPGRREAILVEIRQLDEEINRL